MRSYSRLIVTGHLGFIASAFCANFRDRYEIVGVDFAGWGSMERNNFAGVRDIRADIADSNQIRSILEDVGRTQFSILLRATSIAPMKTTPAFGGQMSLVPVI